MVKGKNGGLKSIIIPILHTTFQVINYMVLFNWSSLL
jgi:hypothetical protein